MKTKWMMVGKKTLAKHIVLEKIAFGYVLIEKEKTISLRRKKKKKIKPAKNLLLKHILW